MAAATNTVSNTALALWTVSVRQCASRCKRVPQSRWHAALISASHNKKICREPEASLKFYNPNFARPQATYVSPGGSTLAVKLSSRPFRSCPRGIFPQQSQFALALPNGV